MVLHLSEGDSVKRLFDFNPVTQRSELHDEIQCQGRCNAHLQARIAEDKLRSQSAAALPSTNPVATTISEETAQVLIVVAVMLLVGFVWGLGAGGRAMADWAASKRLVIEPWLLVGAGMVLTLVFGLAIKPLLYRRTRNFKPEGAIFEKDSQKAIEGMTFAFLLPIVGCLYYQINFSPEFMTPLLSVVAACVVGTFYLVPIKLDAIKWRLGLMLAFAVVCVLSQTQFEARFHQITHTGVSSTSN